MAKIKVNYEEMLGKKKISPLVGKGDFLNENLIWLFSGSE